MANSSRSLARLRVADAEQSVSTKVRRWSKVSLTEGESLSLSATGRFRSVPMTGPKISAEAEGMMPEQSEERFLR